jgi:hypothetical protein
MDLYGWYGWYGQYRIPFTYYSILHFTNRVFSVFSSDLHCDDIKYATGGIQPIPEFFYPTSVRSIAGITLNYSFQ